MCNTFIIKVSRRDHPPPKLIFDEKIGLDATIQEDYLKDRTIEYGRIAAEVSNRVIRYFKYHLWQPLIVEISDRDDCIMNPKWSYENFEFEIVGSGYVQVKASPAIAMLDFGVIRLEKKYESSLSKYLKSSFDPALEDEILYDAQSAIYLKNYRRAVLELALSVEVLVKKAIFGKESYGGQVFEYLEDKGKVNIRVLELISGVSLQVFGSSFKKEYSNEFKNIDHLFRARNKVAHRGKAYIPQVDRE